MKGQKLKKAFNGRFGDRINIAYTDKPMRMTEQCIQNGKICKAFAEVLSGIMHREPTEAEIFGLRNVSIKRGKSRVVKRGEEKNEFAKGIS